MPETDGTNSSSSRNVRRHCAGAFCPYSARGRREPRGSRHISRFPRTAKTRSFRTLDCRSIGIRKSREGSRLAILRTFHPAAFGALLRLLSRKDSRREASSLRGAWRAFFSWTCNPRRVFLGVVFIALHLSLDRATVVFHMSVGTDVWYPPAGLALALLMGLGVSYAPLIF